MEDCIQELDYIEVEFRNGRLGYYQNKNKLNLQPDDLIIVEVERGEDIAQIIHLAFSEAQIPPLPEGSKPFEIKRIATQTDINKIETLEKDEEKAAGIFMEILARYPFAMKLIDTVYQFDANKLTFFFSADGRIDFRVFVRELANVFRTRIELHQTTGRDEAKRLGGFGMCGNPYCCGSFLKRFSQVTIKMAKDQNLAGNLSKISGPCGRLLCCLNFEEDFYVEESKDYPLLGTCVICNSQHMYVFKIDILNKRVHLTDEDQVLTELSLIEFNKLTIVETPEPESC